MEPSPEDQLVPPRLSWSGDQKPRPPIRQCSSIAEYARLLLAWSFPSNEPRASQPCVSAGGVDLRGSTLLSPPSSRDLAERRLGHIARTPRRSPLVGRAGCAPKARRRRSCGRAALILVFSRQRHREAPIRKSHGACPDCRQQSGPASNPRPRRIGHDRAVWALGSSRLPAAHPTGYLCIRAHGYEQHKRPHVLVIGYQPQPLIPVF